VRKNQYSVVVLLYFCHNINEKGGEGELRVGFANVREGEKTKDVSSEHIS
jgi:hypothetical protein